MSEEFESGHDDKGLSARQFILMFLVGVAVCAVFFAAGYLVGYNERSSKNAVSTEQVGTPPAAPPVVNPPPASSSGSAGKEQEITADNGMEQSAEPLKVDLPTTKKKGAAAGKSKAAKSTRSARGEVTAGAATRGSFVVQVTASSNRQDVEKVARMLKSKGYPAFVASPGTGRTNDRLYRVRVGPFRTREDADKARDELAREGFKQPFVVH